MSDEMVFRADYDRLFEAAWRAGILSPDEPWMYMYSLGPRHYFKHHVTRRYRVWEEETMRGSARGDLRCERCGAVLRYICESGRVPADLYRDEQGHWWRVYPDGHVMATGPDGDARPE